MIPNDTGSRRLRTPGALRLLAACALGLGWGQAHAAPLATLQLAPKAQDDADLLENYCYDCHGDGEKKGHLALDDLIAEKPSQATHQEWVKAWRNVRQEFMPPVDADATPDSKERRVLVDWIEQRELGIDFDHPDPGRVTIRRLNRVEYEYCISDLFGVDYDTVQEFGTAGSGDGRGATTQLRDKLPPDDTANDFDNDGDFLTLSPGLLERFFDVAEWVVDHTISMDGPQPRTLSLSRALRTSVAPETRSASESGSFNAPYAGRHRMELQFTAGAFKAKLGTFEAVLSVDGKPVHREVLDIGGNQTLSISQEVDLSAGRHQWAFSTRGLQGPARSETGVNVLAPKLHARLVGPLDPRYYTYSESHRRIFYLGDPPQGEAAQRAYAKAILKRVADRAFRRPIDDAMADKLADIAMSEPDFAHGIRQGLVAILVSPRFLFRAELQSNPDDPRAVQPLDDYALASRLSTLLWLSIPDKELYDLAAAGTLRQHLDEQALRMLADPKAERFFEDFPGQWLRTRNILVTPLQNHAAVDSLRGAMKTETEMLFEYIARHDRNMMELVTADYTFLNRQLAHYYGVPGVTSNNFVKVDLPPGSHRGGILTQASFLISTSNPNRTSPVKRGLYVLDCLWNVQPPPPPPTVPAVEDARVNGVQPLTLHEQLAAHRANPACAACHAYFDPMGVSLENYDVLGRYRTMEAGEKIIVDEKTVYGDTLTGVGDLRKMLAARPDKLYRAVTEKLMTYALGRGLEPFDAPTVDRITDRLVESQGKFSTLLIGLVESPAFQFRRGDDGTPVSLERTDIPKTPTPEEIQRMRAGRSRAKAAPQNAQIPASSAAPQDPPSNSK